MVPVLPIVRTCIFFINYCLVLDKLGSLSILECLSSLFLSLYVWVDIEDHDSLGVASQGVLKQMGKLAVTVSNVLRIVGSSGTFGKIVYHCSQS